MTLAVGQHNTATLDHLTPKSRNGQGPKNLVASCLSCNQLKGNMTEPEFRIFLVTGQKPPGAQPGRYAPARPPRKAEGKPAPVEAPARPALVSATYGPLRGEDGPFNPPRITRR